METIYRADDGAEFTSLIECENYERRLRNPMSVLAVDNDEAISPEDIAEDRDQAIEMLSRVSLVPGFLGARGVNRSHFHFEISTADVTDGRFWEPSLRLCRYLSFSDSEPKEHTS